MTAVRRQLIFQLGARLEQDYGLRGADARTLVHDAYDFGLDAEHLIEHGYGPQELEAAMDALLAARPRKPLPTRPSVED